MKVVTTISLESDQRDFLKTHKISLSKLVRDAIAKRMEKEEEKIEKKEVEVIKENMKPIEEEEDEDIYF